MFPYSWFKIFLSIKKDKKNKMGFLKNTREFILRFDLFSTNAGLRYKGEPCY